ncbi:MAG: glycoside hydrolase family 99-like domain-containing protein [Planctomycetia bacterium]|nr:glycoside hydrolase family 99-like domain-containing protein [Planctomycetia bacterium]
MSKRLLTLFLLPSTLLAWLSVCFVNASYSIEPETLISWDFSDQPSVDAWGKNCLRKPECVDGALSSEFTDWDPFIVSPTFEIKPKAGQFIEIRMKSNGYGNGEIFFASSHEGPYNGFSQAKSFSWPICHDGEYHTYQLLPPWNAEPRIIKIRVDFGVPTGRELQAKAGVSVDYIRIMETNLDDLSGTSQRSWTGEDLAALSTGDKPRVYTSSIQKYDLSQLGSNLSLTLRRIAPCSTVYARASLNLYTIGSTGVVSQDLALYNLNEDADATLSRNVDLKALGNFQDAPIYRWEVKLPSEYELTKVEFSDSPIGSASLERQEGRQIALSRLPESSENASGQTVSVKYETTLRNCGGSKLSDLRIESLERASGLTLESAQLQKITVDPLFGMNPQGNRLASSGYGQPVKGVEPVTAEANSSGVATFPHNFTLAPNEAIVLQATYRASKPGSLNDLLRISGHNGKDGASTLSIDCAVKLNVLAPCNLPIGTSYIPEPQPVSSDYEIGAYYFPGWSKRSGWDKINDNAPERKPLLGYYDEGNPEAVDWQIKWAVENGLSFFFVDWYWYHGEVRLEHWVKAFQQARYRHYMKWAVMWANHTGAGTHSTEDWENVTNYWIKNYFNTPEYYKIDGKPVVVIWDKSIVERDMVAEAAKNGVTLNPGEGCKRAFEICRQKCEEAGFPGVYFIAIKWPEHATDSKTIQTLADSGFDATTIYHFMYPGKEVEDPKLYSFDSVVEASYPNWKARLETGILPDIPNISTGWDSRPWHGYRQTVVYDRTVAGFRRLLEDYKRFASESGNKRVVIAPVNEWGEGSYIEPNNEFGFGMYEAIRETLCHEPSGGFPSNYAPYEIGLGPYDIPPTTDPADKVE